MFQQLVALLGGNPLNAIKDIIQTFKLPPEQQLQFDMAMAKTEADMTVGLAKIDAEDRNSARQREVNTNDSKNVWYLATGITCGFFAVLFYMMNYSVPKDAERVIDVMLGSLGTAWISVIAYYFGSSSGSQHKHQLIDKMVTNANAALTATNGKENGHA